MALKNYQFDEIMRNYERTQMRHKHILDQHTRTAYEKLPALKELDALAADASVSCMEQLLAGRDDAGQALEQKLSDISEQRKQLLEKGGFPPDYLSMTYSCPICKDTGFDPDGNKCVCFRKAAIDLLYRESDHREQYEKENFSTFSLKFYDPDAIDPNTGESAYVQAKKALLAAHEYVDRFCETPGSLVIYGPTGVGKTFLSNCIAKELIESIHSVVHLGAIDFFEQLASHQFRQEEEEEPQYDSIFQCDLLIIDDLGTEIANSFVINRFCHCIDHRLKNRRGTIITTNLELADLKAQYLDRAFSRLISGYTFLRMTGSDIRYQQKQHTQAK